ncbi:hypothetical protein C6P42_000504, partial [Pichia californica]
MKNEAELITVGVLALQGSYHEHISHLNSLFEQLNENIKYNCRYKFISKEVKTAEELIGLNGLILPGGESTTISILLQRNKMLEPLRKLIQIDKLPCWGTCAGLILLSNKIINTKIDLGGENIEQSMKYRSIGGLDVCIERNSFGRQIDSFKKKFILHNFEGELKNSSFDCIFIRAPVIKTITKSKSNQIIEHDVKNSTVYAPDLNIDKNMSREVPKVLLKINTNFNDELIVAVRQNNIFGTSFHPELVPNDYRLHQ